ncbi:MAG: M15 family metallopeptidase [Candidatus Staskawiczbacteria bacterium]|jgi:D-alanyl-D-alanine carboxypeptidase
MTRKIIFLIFVVLILASTIFILYFYEFKNKTIKISVPEAIEQKNINDDDLLLKVNKQNCLLADYVPSDLIDVLNYQIPASKSFKLRKVAIYDLKAMINQAKQEGISLKVISAYRSYQDQKRIYNSWVDKLGQKEASRQSAPQGCSEHQLGTTIDFNKLDSNFANEPAGIWLEKNAYKYGWVISYPANSEKITGYIYEPWHYRYIGIDNALNFKNSGLILSEFLNK